MAATILVVEDEPAIQELISYSLRQAKHVVSSARNAEEAMELINNALPDLVLLDWMLPGMSGTEFARMLRRTTRTKTIPIIISKNISAFVCINTISIVKPIGN